MSTSELGRPAHGPLLIAVIAATVALPAMHAALSGNLSFPHADAWACGLTAQHVGRTGTIRLLGWNQSFTVGQAIALGPLGRFFVAQQLFVGVLAVVALGATFTLLRRSMSPARAVFGTAIVAAFPGFGLLATSFMQDIPTFCAIVLTLLIGAIAIERNSQPGLLAAVLTGIGGFTIREQALAALVAVLAAAFISWSDREHRIRVVALAGTVAVVLLALEAWRRSLPNGQAPYVTADLANGTLTCISMYFTLGLLVLPASLAVARPSAWARPAVGLALLAGLVGAVFVARSHALLVGNYLQPHGAYSGVLIGTRIVLPPAIWDALQFGAWVGGILLVGLVVERARRLDPLLGIFGLLTVLGTAFEALAGDPSFDRFLIPLVPVVLVMILRRAANDPDAPGDRRAQSWRLASASGALAALLLVSLVITANGLAFDAARWHAAQALVRAGSNPRTIDAGLEWVGYHSPVAAVDARPTEQRANLPRYAQSLFPTARECYVLSSSPVAGVGRVVRTFTYRTYLALGRGRLLLYRTGRCDA